MLLGAPLWGFEQRIMLSVRLLDVSADSSAREFDPMTGGIQVGGGD